MSRKKIIKNCIICNKEFLGSKTTKTCSKICRYKLTENTFIERYGVINPGQNQEIKDKIKETFISKYGVINPGQLESTIIKREKTNLKKYGNKIPMRNKNIKEKCIKKVTDKFGGMGTSSKIINSKIEKTNLEKYTRLSYYSKRTQTTLV